ncbi:MAG: agmatine deiminase family protein [Candidatus Aegiribacteria sp.]|nr:agmatine deiminase family protein [Candidatus Aegiribacteria sp.]
MKLASILLILVAAAYAEMSVCGTEELLPIGFTDEELLRLDDIGLNTIPTAPPPDGTVNPGEFDPSTGVFVRWPLGLPYSLITSLSLETTVWVICTSGQQSSVETAFVSAGVNMSNIDFMFAPTNSIWVRDYGPWFVLLEDGHQGIFNYSYNRPRPDDNDIPVVVGSAWGIPVYTSTIEHTGGNYMSSGFGQAMSTDLVYSENGGNEDWVDTQMGTYLGIDTYVTMEDPLSYVSIDHIDCWAKMLSPDRLLVLRLPPSHPDYVVLEAAADILASTESPFGTNWEVYRVESSGSEGYTNSLISNDHVYVPTFGSSNDPAAIDVYETALPGYTIEGIQYGGWLPDDALHCRTRNVMDNEMLFIRHIPVDSPQLSGNPVAIDALIRCHPDNTLNGHDVYYRIGTSGSFTSLPMTSSGSDSFTVNIPGATGNETVQYYISASDNSGRDESQPRFAPETWFFEYETYPTGISQGHCSITGISIEIAEPNPFRNAISIQYSTASLVPVSMTVCDISGKVVAATDNCLEAGSDSFTWTPDDTVPAGVYIIRLEGSGCQTAQKITLIR